MIGKLRGQVDTLLEDAVILDVGGVGYLVHVATKTLDNLSRRSDEVVLFIETVVREDLIKLYGFSSGPELAWFRLLTSVQGVGARTALAIFSTLSVADISTAIAFGDKSAFVRAPGVGAKMAQRIVNELKDKQPKSLGGEVLGSASQGSDQTLQVDQDMASDQTVIKDARSALINLGYPDQRATQAVMAAKHQCDETPTTEMLIKLALKDLMR